MQRVSACVRQSRSYFHSERGSASTGQCCLVHAGSEWRDLKVVTMSHTTCRDGLSALMTMADGTEERILSAVLTRLGGHVKRASSWRSSS